MRSLHGPCTAAGAAGRRTPTPSSTAVHASAVLGCQRRPCQQGPNVEEQTCLTGAPRCCASLQDRNIPKELDMARMAVETLVRQMANLNRSNQASRPNNRSCPIHAPPLHTHTRHQTMSATHWPLGTPPRPARTCLQDMKEALQAGAKKQEAWQLAADAAHASLSQEVGGLVKELASTQEQTRKASRAAPASLPCCGAATGWEAVRGAPGVFDAPALALDRTWAPSPWVTPEPTTLRSAGGGAAEAQRHAAARGSPPGSGGAHRGEGTQGVGRGSSSSRGWRCTADTAARSLVEWERRGPGLLVGEGRSCQPCLGAACVQAAAEDIRQEVRQLTSNGAGTQASLSAHSSRCVFVFGGGGGCRNCCSMLVCLRGRTGHATCLPGRLAGAGPGGVGARRAAQPGGQAEDGGHHVCRAAGPGELAGAGTLLGMPTAALASCMPPNVICIRDTAAVTR